MKYLVHNICGSASSAQISSASMELFVFSLFFFDMLSTDPRPKDMVAPVRLSISSYAA